MSTAVEVAPGILVSRHLIHEAVAATSDETEFERIEAQENIKKRAIPGQALHMLDLMSDQIMRADLMIVGLKNDEAVLANHYKHVKIRLVQPQRELVTNSLEFDPHVIRRLIDAGYQDADNAAARPGRQADRPRGTAEACPTAGTAARGSQGRPAER